MLKMKIVLFVAICSLYIFAKNGASGTFDICSSTEVFNAATYNPLEPLQVLIFAEDYFWEFDIVHKTISDKKRVSRFWKGLETPVQAADTIFRTPNGTQQRSDFLFIKGSNLFYYECQGSIGENYCHVKESNLSLADKFDEAPMSLLTHGQRVPDNDTHILVHLYFYNQHNQVHCSIAREDLNEFHCISFRESAHENLVKLKIGYEPIFGISAYHWRTPNITDFFAIGPNTARFTHLGRLQTVNLQQLFGCWSWMSFLRYVFAFLTFLAIVTVLGTSVWVYQRLQVRALAREETTGTTVVKSVDHPKTKQSK